MGNHGFRAEWVARNGCCRREQRHNVAAEFLLILLLSSSPLTGGIRMSHRVFPGVLVLSGRLSADSGFSVLACLVNKWDREMVPGLAQNRCCQA